MTFSPKLCCLLLLVVAAAAQPKTLSGAASTNSSFQATQLQTIRANDNRTAAGRLENGVLTLRLVIAQGTWYPEVDGHEPSLQVLVFGEEGGPLTNPGPLIRVPEDTELHVSVKNLYEKPLFVHGLGEGPVKTSFKLEPGEVHEVDFRSGPPGTYSYWPNLLDMPLFKRPAEATQLSGALIVDPPGERANDRVFVIGYWLEYIHPDKGLSGGAKQVLAVNGKSWPWTERLEYHVGEEVRWRWINASGMPHPMHLHGAYFRIDSTGNGDKESPYSAPQRRYVVTEQMGPGGTLGITWVPEHAGHWLFHCHLLFHIMRRDALNYQLTSLLETHEADDPGAGMSGLVVGINVLPDNKREPKESKHARKLDLELGEASGQIRIAEREGSRVVAESIGEMGPLLVLSQNQLTRINVHNGLSSPTAIHWHGMELASYFDGVPGWDADQRGTTPPIAPGGSFIAEMAPPRAGTFMYHTHWHDVEQLTNGLYGPLVVLPPGQSYDARTDRVLLISRGAAGLLSQSYTHKRNGQPRPIATANWGALSLTADQHHTGGPRHGGQPYGSRQACCLDGNRERRS